MSSITSCYILMLSQEKWCAVKKTIRSRAPLITHMAGNESKAQ